MFGHKRSDDVKSEFAKNLLFKSNNISKKNFFMNKIMQVWLKLLKALKKFI